MPTIHLECFCFMMPSIPHAASMLSDSMTKMLKRAGVKEVHMRICAPPIRYPCFFGVDMATRRELIAAQKTIPEVRDFIGADSLGHLSIDGLIKAVALPKDIFCLACFTGDYPIPVQLEMDKLALETMSAGQQDRPNSS